MASPDYDKDEFIDLVNWVRENSYINRVLEPSIMFKSKFDMTLYLDATGGTLRSPPPTKKGYLLCWGF